MEVPSGPDACPFPTDILSGPAPNQGRINPKGYKAEAAPQAGKGSRIQKRLGQTVLLSPPSLPLLPLLGLAVHNVQPEPVPSPSLLRPYPVPSLSLSLTCP